MRKNWLTLLVMLVVTTLGAFRLSAAAEDDPNAVKFFESSIRPVLAEKCYLCHGPQLQQGALRLDSREAMLKGGARGAAIVPGKPEKSWLIRAVQFADLHLKMPPTGKLKDAEIANLVAWVKMGAPWTKAAVSPEAQKAAQSGTYVITPEQKRFWCFQPVQTPKIPAIKNKAWVKNPIDNFILAQLEAAGLKPAPPADKRTLIRRAYFDLIGLPPTPEEMDAFLKDTSPNAFAQVVDKLLASPHYGERWARHWLDCVRYADSNGQDENTAHAHAFRYRDYVIDALNNDLPYDQFVLEQLAGDLLPKSADEKVNYRRLTATGFLVLGPKILAEPDKVKMAMDIIDEQIDVTSKVFLGLTVSCARCHDHKFDPITQRDYYALAGIFKSTKTMATYATVARWFERPLAAQEAVDKESAHAKAVADLKKAMDEADKKKADATIIQALKDARASLEKAKPSVPYAMAVQDDKVENVKVHVRGDHNNLGDIVPRHFLTVIAGENQTPLPENVSGRLELARWIANPRHPLTARVMVNRLFQWHFGRGIVGTSDNFGKLGGKPTHPELLDYLALRLVKNGWSLKKMHREIMLSATYQQSSLNPHPSTLVKDANNILLSRFNRRRLEAEPLRDAMLSISGRLDKTMGGTLLTTPNYGYVTNDQSANAAQYGSARRSIYLPVIRNALFEMFQVFDFVDPSVVSTFRTETTVAPQALFMMNNPLVVDCARQLATNLLADPQPADALRVQTAYLKVFGRPAQRGEVSKSLAFLTDYAAAVREQDQSCTPENARLKAWQSFCQALFCANEFAYVD
jgi:cytochrome c553